VRCGNRTTAPRLLHRMPRLRRVLLGDGRQVSFNRARDIPLALLPARSDPATAQRTFVMTRAEHRDISNNRQSSSGCVCPNLERPLRRLLRAIPFATMLATTGGPALLNANLQTEETVYLNATQAQKAAAGAVMILPEVHANILLRAFPTNPAYGYDPTTGIPFAPPLPAPILAAVSAATNSIWANTQVNAVKGFIGATYNIYGNQYTYSGPYSSPTDSNGDPAPFQMSAAIGSNPFTVANSSALAYQIQQNDPTNIYGQSWAANTQTSDFPSAHTMLGNGDAISYAILAPGYYQQLVLAGVEFGYGTNVFGVHYPLDTIGGRILVTYVIAETLAGNPLYNSVTTFIPGNLASLSGTMQTYLGGGGSSPYAAPCAGNVAACVAGGVIPTAAAYTQAIQNYTYYLTYGLPSATRRWHRSCRRMPTG
jgi:subtilase-type serine protease